MKKKIKGKISRKRTPKKPIKEVLAKVATFDVGGSGDIKIELYAGGSTGLEKAEIAPSEVIELDDDFTKLIPPPEVSEEATKYVESMKDKVEPSSKLTFKDHIWYMREMFMVQLRGLFSRHECPWCGEPVYFYHQRKVHEGDTLHKRCYRDLIYSQTCIKYMEGKL